MVRSACMRRVALPTLAGLLLSVGGRALAADGVLEINQACAAGAGCFAGDAAGFRATISASGSYRLTSNLSPTAAVNGIQSVSGTSHVTLDLNGFAIIGSASALQGIFIDAGVDWEIRNGVVRGFAEHGISDSASGSGHRAIDVRAIDSGLYGIHLTARGSLIRDCYASGNLAGLAVGPEGTITGSTSENNVGGISSDGITAGRGSRVAGNVSSGNAGDGIRTQEDCIVLDNTVRGNTGFGLRLGDSSTGHARNSVNGNAGGSVAGGTQLGPNVCDGSTTCLPLGPPPVPQGRASGRRRAPGRATPHPAGSRGQWGRGGRAGGCGASRRRGRRRRGRART